MSQKGDTWESEDDVAQSEVAQQEQAGVEACDAESAEVLLGEAWDLTLSTSAEAALDSIVQFTQDAKNDLAVATSVLSGSVIFQAEHRAAEVMDALLALVFCEGNRQHRPSFASTFSYDRFAFTMSVIQNQRLRWMLVDEVSMISDVLLGDFEHQLSGAARAIRYRARPDKARRSFGGYNVLFFGDLWQLAKHSPEEGLEFRIPKQLLDNTNTRWLQRHDQHKRRILGFLPMYVGMRIRFTEMIRRV